MGIEKAAENQRRFAAIADLTGSERYRQLMQSVLPRHDINSLLPQRNMAADIAAAVDAGQKATTLLGSPTAVASIIGQQQDMVNSFAALGRMPIAEMMKGLELPRPILDMPKVSELAASLDIGPKNAAIMSPSIVETVARQHDDLLRQFASIGRTRINDMLGGIDLRNMAVFDTRQRLNALWQSDYFKGLMDSLRTLPQRMLGMADLADSFRTYLRDLRPLEWLAAKELAERGWWLVPTWSTTVVTRFMAERHERGCSIGVVLAEHYRKQKCRDLGRIVRSWICPSSMRTGGRRCSRRRSSTSATGSSAR